MVNTKVAKRIKIKNIFLQYMEKIKTLNNSHAEIIDTFFNDVDKFIYDITDNVDMTNAFKKFRPLKRQAQRLHNALGENITDRKIQTEWVFMLPNFMLFAAIGFATALKSDKNEIEINELCDDLFYIMQSTITDLDEMIDVHFTEEDTQKLIKKLKTKNKKTK